MESMQSKSRRAEGELFSLLFTLEQCHKLKSSPGDNAAMFLFDSIAFCIFLLSFFFLGFASHNFFSVDFVRQFFRYNFSFSLSCVILIMNETFTNFFSPVLRSMKNFRCIFWIVSLGCCVCGWVFAFSLSTF